VYRKTQRRFIPERWGERNSGGKKGGNGMREDGRTISIECGGKRGIQGKVCGGRWEKKKGEGTVTTAALGPRPEEGGGSSLSKNKK